MSTEETNPVPSAPAVSSDQQSVRRKRRPGVAPRRGKQLRNKIKSTVNKIEKEGVQALKKAVETLKSVKRAKFDETVEVHMKLGVDTRQADQAVRGTVSLPNGLGKTVRILVFCQGDDVAKAQAAGADFVGGTELIQKIQSENWMDFDVVLATQGMMGQVARLGKVLGPRGLMPTPKAGTVIAANGDVAQAINEFKAGKVEYRADSGGCVHAGVGKISFPVDKIVENIQTFVDQIRAVKPSAVKGIYVQSISISTTMSPGVFVNA
ncbi:MAG: 50S ribosomal protein L1 [Zavarzinella sp.]